MKKTQIVSEFGEPLNWQKDGDIPHAEGPYELCRCGHSKEKPFCDATHCEIDFDGTETAHTNTFAERQNVDERGSGHRGEKRLFACAWIPGSAATA